MVTMMLAEALNEYRGSRCSSQSHVAVADQNALEKRQRGRDARREQVIRCRTLPQASSRAALAFEPAVELAIEWARFRIQHDTDGEFGLRQCRPPSCHTG